MNSKVIQVYGQTNLYAAASEQLVERIVLWPGGHGKIHADVISTTGASAKVSFVQGIAGDGLLNISYYELVPGVFPITVDGTWDFCAPAGTLQFEIRLSSGDEISLSGVFLIPCE